jgi:hypothetical protein
MSRVLTKVCSSAADPILPASTYPLNLQAIRSVELESRSTLGKRCATFFTSALRRENIA